MDERNSAVRAMLLRRYYKTAALGWFRPRCQHWVKVEFEEDLWRWCSPNSPIRGRFLRSPPLHVYQTVLSFVTAEPPRGWSSEGHLLGGPLIFDADLGEKHDPVSLYRLLDSVDMLGQLRDVLADHGYAKRIEVMFSGHRGVHVRAEQPASLESPIALSPEKRRPRELKGVIRERTQVARSIGKWCEGWDWMVSGDIWRVSRVPWSIHGGSALRAITLHPPYTTAHFREQLRYASPFSSERQLRLRVKRATPLFTFIDGESYGPFRKGWVTRLPIAVALHLIWLGYARPREEGPKRPESWFDSGWQTLFRQKAPSVSMAESPVGGGDG